MAMLTTIPLWAGRIFALLLLLNQPFLAVIAQQKIPVIKATSSLVDVMDGDYFRRGVWDLSPEIRPDRFYPIGPRKARQMTFYTDIDSISFFVEPGKMYDFIILLNGKDSCFTQICWPSPKINRRSSSPDTIPFLLGTDNRIHLLAQINNSPKLDFVFDTGAYGIILSSVARNQVDLKFDGVNKALGYGGTYTDSTSSRNRFSLSKLNLDNVTIAYNERETSNGVIGFKIFENKILEIDYDKLLIVVHDSAITIPPGYVQLDMQLRGRLPFMKATLNDLITDWFCFDTGNTGSLNLDDEFSIRHDLYAGLEKLGEGVAKGAGPNNIRNILSLLPSLKIGEFTLTEVPVRLELPSRSENIAFGLIGNDVLKRFNTIIDYQNSYIYLRPNSFVDIPFRQQRKEPVVQNGGLQVYAGVYQLEDRSIVEITVENGQLTGRPKNGEKRGLTKIGQHRFFGKEGGITLDFEMDGEGKVNGVQLSQRGQQMSAKRIWGSY